MDTGKRFQSFAIQYNKVNMIKEPLFHVKQWLFFAESVKSIAQTSKLSERFSNNPYKPAYFTVLTYNEISRFIYSSGGFNLPTLCGEFVDYYCIIHFGAALLPFAFPPHTFKTSF